MLWVGLWAEHLQYLILWPKIDEPLKQLRKKIPMNLTIFNDHSKTHRFTVLKYQRYIYSEFEITVCKHNFAWNWIEKEFEGQKHCFSIYLLKIWILVTFWWGVKRERKESNWYLFTLNEKNKPNFRLLLFFQLWRNQRIQKDINFRRPYTVNSRANPKVYPGVYSWVNPRGYLLGNLECGSWSAQYVFIICVLLIDRFWILLYFPPKTPAI